MSLTFSVHVYHGGYLMSSPNVKYYGGSVDCFDNLKYDKTGILNVEGYLKGLLWHNQFSAIWYSKPSCSTFDENLEPLKDDFDIMEMMKFASEHDNKISIYIERPIDSDVVEAQQGNDEVGVDSVQFDHDSEDDSFLGISFEESDTSDDNFEKDERKEFEGVADDETEEQTVNGDQTRNEAQGEDDWDGIHTDEEELQDINDEDEEQHSSIVSFPEFKEPYDPKNIKFKLGLLFKTRQFLKKVLIDYAIYSFHALKFVKNDKERVKVRCVGKNCEWALHASPYRNTEAFQVRSHCQHHTCSMVHDNKKASDSWLASQWVKTLKKQPSITVNDLLLKARSKWNLDLSKQKVYRAKRKAELVAEGAVDGQYKLLPRYFLEVIESNIGSSCYIKCVTQDEADLVGPSRILVPRFERLYYCLNAWKQGFLAACRPLIGLDGCHLKGVHGGQLLAAVSKDPNDRIYVIAVAVVEVESHNSWSWFLDNLLNDIGSIEDKGWTFISDQQKGLEKCFANYPVEVNHRYCVRHLYNNFRKHYPSMQLKDKLWNAARATYFGAWKKEMDEMKALDAKAWEIMMKKDPRTWTRSAFSPYSKCDVLLNNMSESFNSTIIEARSKPIITMLEMIRNATMKRFSENRENILKFKGLICPMIQKKLNKEKKESTKWSPLWCGRELYQVSSGPYCTEGQYSVDLSKMTCSCRKWDISGIPCRHAVAAMMKAGEEPEQYVHKCYTREAYIACYEPIVHATRGEDQWPEAELKDLKPPAYKRAGGRPRKLRRLEPDEQRPGKCGTKLSRRTIVAKCGKCGRVGHNSRTCKGDRIEANDAARKKVARKNGNKQQQDEPTAVTQPRKRARAQTGSNSGSVAVRPAFDEGPTLRTEAFSTQPTSRGYHKGGPTNATQ